MSNYTKQISWSGKDALSDSDSEKVISGGDFDTEFSAVQTAINSKIDGGTITNFTSTGIDDNATSTAITIDSGENVELANALTVPSTVHLTGSDHRIVTGTDTGRAIFSNATTSAYMSLHGANFSSNPNAVLFNAPGGVVANSCNLIMSNGFGIDFSADGNAAGMTSEVLDDYEEGTWTPTISGQTTSGTGTYSEQSGTYTKVGNKVTVNCTLAWSAHTGTGNMRIIGQPFTTATGVYAGSLYYSDFFVSATADDLFVYASGTRIDFRGGRLDGSSRELVTIDTAGTMYITITYTAA